ncbi:Hypothetical protein D9617_20g027510 [Elsinoe fawcettii]|nr:Hypothetical protein D9617_20g027510 [Elsinoe fawcettii]
MRLALPFLTILLTSATYTAAAPTSLGDALAKICRLTAFQNQTYVIGSGGPGQSPVFLFDSGFVLRCVGTEEVKRFDGNTISTKWQTLPSDKLGLKQNLDYYGGGGTFLTAYDECKVSYNHVEYTGKWRSNDKGDCAALSKDCRYCVVRFARD